MAPCPANRRLVVRGRIEECSSTGHGLCHLSINKSNDITMAKKAKKVKTAKGAELRIVNPDAAGQGQQPYVRSIYIRPACHLGMAQGMRHKDSRNGIHRGLLDTAVLSSSGGRAGCRIDQRKGREEHNGEENRRVGCRMADVAAPVRVAQGKFPTAQRRQTDEDTHPSS